MRQVLDLQIIILENVTKSSYFGTPGSGIGSQPDYILAKVVDVVEKEPLIQGVQVDLVVVQVAVTQHLQTDKQHNQEQTQVLL